MGSISLARSGLRLQQNTYENTLPWQARGTGNEMIKDMLILIPLTVTDQAQSALERES